MKLVIISPEGFEPREHVVLAGLFASGLERYHVRKPGWNEAEVRRFIRGVPEQWRSRLVLHQSHELAAELGCGGVHYKDKVGRGTPAELGANAVRSIVAPCLLSSRSCHTVAALEAALGHCDSVFFSPVFPSISKRDYGPTDDVAEVSSLLNRRSVAQRRTTVVALGGIKPENAMRCGELGFDGVAVLGALWQAEKPLKVFDQLQEAISSHAARSP